MRNPVFASHNALNWCLVRKHCHLRNTLMSGCNSELLSIQTDVTFGILTVTEGCRLRTITTNLVGRHQKSEKSKPCSTDLNCLVGSIKSSTKLNAYKPGLHESTGVQHYNLQQKLVDSRILEWPATVFVVDIETTGFSRQRERIIEIAIRDLLGGKNSTFQTLINPKKKVLNSDIHGITSQMVNRTDVPGMEDLIPILIQFVRSRQMAGKPVLWVAHNGRRFDIPFIIKEFDRCSKEIPSDWVFVDTLPIARQLVKHDGSKLSSLSLEALRKHYEIPLLGPSHRAMQDVMTLCIVLQKMSFELKLSVAQLLERAFQASDITKI